jgi:hypothetical protein
VPELEEAERELAVTFLETELVADGESVLPAARVSPVTVALELGAAVCSEEEEMSPASATGRGGMAGETAEVESFGQLMVPPWQRATRS